MSLSEEEAFFGLTPGCPLHGEEFLRECSMCGIEFCTRCFRGSAICADCAEEANEDDPEDDPDFEDVANVKEFLDEDAEVEKIIKASEEMAPPEDLADDTRPGYTRPGDTNAGDTNAGDTHAGETRS